MPRHFEQVTEVAFRVIDDNEAECYRALGFFTPLRHIGQIHDYISTPKTNGYRSLHTSLIYENSMRGNRYAPAKCTDE
jgi:GTP pyrophosphokinase